MSKKVTIIKYILQSSFYKDFTALASTNLTSNSVRKFSASYITHGRRQRKHSYSPVARKKKSFLSSINQQHILRKSKLRSKIKQLGKYKITYLVKSIIQAGLVGPVCVIIRFSILVHQATIPQTLQYLSTAHPEGNIKIKIDGQL